MIIWIKSVEINDYEETVVGYVDRKGVYKEVVTDQKYFKLFRDLEGLIADVKGQFYNTNDIDHFVPCCIVKASDTQVRKYIKMQKKLVSSSNIVSFLY